MRQILVSAYQAVAQTQSDGRLPDWFWLGAGVDEQKIAEDLWIVKFYASPQRTLKEGEHWVQRGKGKYVAQVDPKTNVEMITIIDDSNLDQRINLFEVEVNLKEKTERMLKTTDLASIDLSKLDIRTTELPASFDPESLYRK